MSIEEQKFQEIDTEIVLSKEDLQHVRNYAEHFGMTLPKELEESLQSYEKDLSFKNQNKIKNEICKWMATSTHESFQDPIWVEAKKYAQELTYHYVFDEQLDKVLSGEEI